MKKKHTRPIKLIDTGMDEWEYTDEYKSKVNKIITEVTEKYSAVLASENNWFKRLIIKLRRARDIRKRINELSSLKNLHAAGSALL